MSYSKTTLPRIFAVEFACERTFKSHKHLAKLQQRRVIVSCSPVPMRRGTVLLKYLKYKELVSDLMYDEQKVLLTVVPTN